MSGLKLSHTLNYCIAHALNLKSKTFTVFWNSETYAPQNLINLPMGRTTVALTVNLFCF